MKRTCNEKYGCDYPAQNSEINSKTMKTKQNKYGYSTFNINKAKETWQEKYNVDNPFQLEEVKEKSKETKLKKYGNENYVNPEKAKITNLEKYGVTNVMSVSEIKNKAFKSINETNLKKYGNKWVLSNENVKRKIHLTNLKKYGVKYICLLPRCYEKNGKTVSQINKRFGNLLKTNEIKYKFERKIKNNSYDLEILNTNILVEINPTSTHNSLKGINFNKDKKSYPKDKNYHLNKSKLAEENGYQCIHVFDWDDWNKIINLIVFNKEILYKRNLKLKEVNKIECDKFLNDYHLQGTCRGQDVRFGLYYNNELVQIMTFGKPRYNKNYQWELLRLCNHKDYKIVGGSESLFKHFIKNYNPESIISYCDNAKFNGDVYKRLGFELKSKGNPQCHWSKGREMITQNLLNQRGFDQLFNANYGKRTSNKELMIQHGWLPVYDCGQSTYIWNKM